MRPTRVLEWDIADVARCLKVDVQSVREYFTDGRRVAFLIERRIAKDEGFTLAASEGAAWDLIDSNGERWEVRNITRGGIYFCPSYMFGSGRSFDTAGFTKKLAGVAGYIVSDIECFPSVPYWIIRRNQIERWWTTNCLGAGTKISREKALHLIRHLPDIVPSEEPRVSF